VSLNLGRSNSTSPNQANPQPFEGNLARKGDLAKAILNASHITLLSTDENRPSAGWKTGIPLFLKML
jgi:hypothetical protein